MPTATSDVIIGPDETPVQVSDAGHIYNSQSYDNIVVCVRAPIPDSSGGRQLENAATGSVIIRNASGNHLMFIGGVGMNAPYSGRGLSLFAGETITLPVKNMNAISMMSTHSGEFIECMGFLNGPPNNMDISGMFINPDPDPPILVSVSPTSGSSGVALNANIFATFDECIASGSVDTGNFVVRVSGSATPVSGFVFVDSMNCSKVWFQPYSGLIAISTVYQGVLGQSITDTQGNGLSASGLWSWTTLNTVPPADVTPPRVSGTIPINLEMDVDRNVSPIVQLSESVRSGTVNTTNVFLRISGMTQLPGTVKLFSDLRTIQIDPTDILNQGSIYEIVVNSGVQDLAGNFLNTNPPFNKFMTLMDDDIVYNVAGDGNFSTFGPGANKWRIGMKIVAGNNPNYVGEVMTGFRLYMLRSSQVPISGVASGIQLHIRKASDGSKVVFMNEFDVHVNPAMLSTTFQAFDFHNHSHNYALADGDFVEAEWLSGTTNSGFVRVGLVNTSVNAGAVSLYYGGGAYSGSSYIIESGRDLAGIMWVK